MTNEVESTQAKVYNPDAQQSSFTESCPPLHSLFRNDSGSNEWSYIRTADHVELDATVDTKYLGCRLTPNSTISSPNSLKSNLQENAMDTYPAALIEGLLGIPNPLYTAHHRPSPQWFAYRPPASESFMRRPRSSEFESRSSWDETLRVYKCKVSYIRSTYHCLGLRRRASYPIKPEVGNLECPSKDWLNGSGWTVRPLAYTCHSQKVI